MWGISYICALSSKTPAKAIHISIYLCSFFIQPSGMQNHLTEVEPKTYCWDEKISFIPLYPLGVIYILHSFIKLYHLYLDMRIDINMKCWYSCSWRERERPMMKGKVIQPPSLPCASDGASMAEQMISSNFWESTNICHLKNL